jgi:methionine synthase I (cobalamin-dependent)
MMGVSPKQLLEAAVTRGASFVGANCGLGIEGYLSVAQALCEPRRLPVWIKPNAGLPELVGDEVVYRTGPEEFARHAEKLWAIGVTMLGGCCGSNPDFIRALKAHSRPERD